MRRLAWVVVAGMAVGCVAGLGQSSKGVREAGVVVDFEKMKAGQKPEGFEMAVSGPGAAGEWFVREDPSAPKGRKVLVQLNADPTNARYPLCILEDLKARDVDVTVAFKPIAGKVDQAAGIVVRYTDKDNYYIARANGLEDNVRLYKVEDGNRKQFAGLEKVTPPAAGTWHTLSLKVAGNKFEVGMDGKKLFEATDETFKEAGKVGLWTKADSVTEFDDLRVVGE
jgi:hypothetical protein